MKTLPSKSTALIGSFGIAISVKGWDSLKDKRRWWIRREIMKLEFLLAHKHTYKFVKYYEREKIKKLIEQKETISLKQFLYRVNRLRTRLGLKPVAFPEP